MIALRASRTSTRLASVASQHVSKRGFQASALRLKHYLDADAQTVKQVINAQDRVVLVDFYADWCNPCKMLSPVLEKLTTGDDAISGSGLPLDLVTVDTDAQTDLATEYKIRSLPTVIAFQNGKPVSQFMGAMPEGSVRNFISKL